MKRIISILSLLLLPIIIFSCGARKNANKKQAYLTKTYKTLKKELPDASVTLVQDTIKVLFPESVLFPSGSSEINTAILPQMEVFGNVLNRYDKTTILINGYTDNTGTPKINQKLSNERAENSKACLVKYKVNTGRLYHWGRADSNPIESNDTPEGRKRNRRVEFIVLYDYIP